MYRSMCYLAVLCCFVALIAWGCDDDSSSGITGAGVDLMPMEDPDNLGKLGGFCGDDSKEVVVSVTNGGQNAITEETITAIIFQNNDGMGGEILSISKQVLGPLGVGQTAVQYFAIPAACSPVCEFEIRLDYEDVLDETSKANNSVIGACGGDEGQPNDGSFDSRPPIESDPEFVPTWD